MRSSTETLISAMRILSNEIDSPDGVANAAILEAADRLKEQNELLKQWLSFSGDVVPSCTAGIDWLEMLQAKTRSSVE